MNAAVWCLHVLPVLVWVFFYQCEDENVGLIGDTGSPQVCVLPLRDLYIQGEQ